MFFFAYFTKQLQKRYKPIFRQDEDSIRSERLGAYSWYLSHVDLARSGIFNKKGITPMESVGSTCIEDIMFYLSAKAVEAQEIKKHQKMMEKRNKK